MVCRIDSLPPLQSQAKVAPDAMCRCHSMRLTPSYTRFALVASIWPRLSNTRVALRDHRHAR
jgi:hypothetical protein